MNSPAAGGSGGSRGNSARLLAAALWCTAHRGELACELAEAGSAMPQREQACLPGGVIPPAGGAATTAGAGHAPCSTAPALPNLGSLAAGASPPSAVMRPSPHVYRKAFTLGSMTCAPAREAAGAPAVATARAGAMLAAGHGGAAGRGGPQASGASRGLQTCGQTGVMQGALRTASRVCVRQCKAAWHPGAAGQQQQRRQQQRPPACAARRPLGT